MATWKEAEPAQMCTGVCWLSSTRAMLEFELTLAGECLEGGKEAVLGGGKVCEGQGEGSMGGGLGQGGTGLGDLAWILTSILIGLTWPLRFVVVYWPGWCMTRGKGTVPHLCWIQRKPVGLPVPGQARAVSKTDCC